MPKRAPPIDPDHPPASQLVHVRLPWHLYRRVLSASVDPHEYHGITGIVIRALEAYLQVRIAGELSFEAVWMRDSTHHMAPSPLERARAYGGRTDWRSARVEFYSDTLRLHHDAGLWNAATGALIERERLWCQRLGVPVLNSIALPPHTAADLPGGAQREFPPGEVIL
jgi:hypothetical protein